MDIRAIPGMFGIEAPDSIIKLDTGHINSTYLAECSGERYIIQALNESVFTDPEAVMENISVMTGIFSAQVSRVRLPEYMRAGNAYHVRHSGKVWRIYRYIPPEDERISAESKSRLAGYSFGCFMKILSSSGVVLRPVIAGFHDISMYCERLSCLSECPGWEEISGDAERLIGIGKGLEDSFSGLPLRCIHGDAKADNVITGDMNTIIDLDTAMNGYAAIDYGDLARSVTVGERKTDIAVMRALTEGYREGAGDMLTAEEKASLFSGLIYVTAELAVRYLADSVSSERYFSSKTAEQCRQRAADLTTQLDMYCRMEDEIRRIIDDCFAD